LGAVNVDEQAQIQLLALSLKELIQSSAMTALDQLFVFLAVIMRSLGEIRCHGGNRITRKDELTPDYARKDELTPDYALRVEDAAQKIAVLDAEGNPAKRPLYVDLIFTLPDFHVNK
jgi:hypothetical protein